MRASLPVLLPLVLSLALLCACGLKDDLYLPAEPAKPPAAADTDADQSEKDHAENSRT